MSDAAGTKRRVERGAVEAVVVELGHHELSGLRHQMHVVIDALEHEIAARKVAGTAG